MNSSTKGKLYLLNASKTAGKSLFSDRGNVPGSKFLGSLRDSCIVMVVDGHEEPAGVSWVKVIADDQIGWIVVSPSHLKPLSQEDE